MSDYLEIIEKTVEKEIEQAVRREVKRILSGGDMDSDDPVSEAEQVADYIVEKGGLSGLGLWATELLSIAIARGAIKGERFLDDRRDGSEEPIKRIEFGGELLNYRIFLAVDGGYLEAHMTIAGSP